jgi:hypothetical protein
MEERLRSDEENRRNKGEPRETSSSQEGDNRIVTRRKTPTSQPIASN